MLMKEQREKITFTVRNWEALEKQSAESIERVKAKCSNALACLVMDIIENDARMHEKLQELIIGSLEREPLTLNLEEVGEVIELIRNHTQLKSQMIGVAEETLGMITDKSLRIQKFLLRTLIADEKKHKEMLEGIEEVRKGLYPYWAH